MVLKRWSYILAAAWLINALFCFYPTNYFEGDQLIAAQNAGNKFTNNTTAGTFFGHLAKQNDHHPYKRINHCNRFVNTPSLDFNIPLPSYLTFPHLAAVKTIPTDHFDFWINRLFLSPLYHFLFRLSPF
jgi:hypothetical protein